MKTSIGIEGGASGNEFSRAEIRSPRPLINHIGVSGGKDSVALLLWAVFESGYELSTIRATFCDTGNESPVTIEHVRLVSERVFPIETIHPPLGFFDLAKAKGRFPSAKARFCTFDLKIAPSREWVAARNREGFRVIEHTGVRRDESPARMHLQEWDYDGDTLCDLRRPLVTWGIKDVLAIHERHGVPLCPLYALGSSRVGCYPCVMSVKAEIAAAAEHFPDVIDLIRAAERATGKQGSTFFSRNIIPEEMRSREVVDKLGNRLKVGTIDDVVRWSKTEWGGRQLALFPSHQYDKGISCSASRGWCE